MILQLYENGTLFRKDNTFCFKNKDDKVTYYPVRTIKTIYVFADVDFNASAINLIHKLSINVIFLNTSHKKIYGLYNGYASQGIYLINQVNAYQNEKRTIIAKSIVSATSHNMIRVLKYHLKTIPELKASMEQILHYKRFLSSLHNVDKIMQTEAMIWKNYYSCFELILGIPFTRYQRGASDLVNCLINFLNGILYAECLDQIILSGLHPAISFLHSSNDRTLSLQYDISEAFKPLLVERTLFSLFHNKIISDNEKPTKDDKTYLLSNAVKKKAAIEFNKHLLTSIKIGNKYYSYRNLIYADCIRLRNYINGETSDISLFKQTNR